MYHGEHQQAIEGTVKEGTTFSGFGQLLRNDSDSDHRRCYSSDALMTLRQNKHLPLKSQGPLTPRRYNHCSPAL
jgi:hypothetical protein